MRDNIPKTNEELEQTVRSVVEWLRTDYPDTINSMVDVRFESCSLEDNTVTLSFFADKWMSNPFWIMHGGAAATVIDIAMGISVCAFGGMDKTSTENISVSYLRPAALGRRFFVRATVDKVGRTAAYARAETWVDGSEDKLASTATGVYYSAEM